MVERPPHRTLGLNPSYQMPEGWAPDLGTDFSGRPLPLPVDQSAGSSPQASPPRSNNSGMPPRMHLSPKLPVQAEPERIQAPPPTRVVPGKVQIPDVPMIPANTARPAPRPTGNASRQPAKPVMVDNEGIRDIAGRELGSGWVGGRRFGWVLCCFLNFCFVILCLLVHLHALHIVLFHAGQIIYMQ